ncbi:hypothetical protein C5167_010755 [Papaver somniferum]|uniref:Uncharacterized protein n=1 Tax=Papaver somniferum TaxID=3469 RepID=A0A4Y7K531_PAPSO|nr:hypothetical protein C5167_010755 [Papaver somniferum]
MVSDSCIWFGERVLGHSPSISSIGSLSWFSYLNFLNISPGTILQQRNGWSITKVVPSSDNTILKQNTILTKTSQSQLGVSASTHFHKNVPTTRCSDFRSSPSP